MPAVPVGRVVAVVAELASERTRVGSGYLLDATRVLTAWHCTIDDQARQAAVSLSVVRAGDGAAAAVVVAEAAPDLDVALLAVTGDPPWGAELPGGPAAFGRLDREQTGELEGCEAVGFPRWQKSEIAGLRDVAEVHGVIRTLEGRESQRLVLRDPVLAGVSAADGGPPWAGFSGAAVFYGGLLIGVVIEHHARQGDTALQIRPVAAITAASDDAARRLAGALGIGRKGALRPVTAVPGRWRAEAAGEAALGQWGWSLASDREGVRHWRPRARGVSIDSEQGWRFRGRTAALRRITSWLDRPRPDRRVLVVTGSPGAGKSAVLGRVVTTADAAIRSALLATVPPGDAGVMAAPGSVSCAVHAKGKTALEVAEEIARAAHAALPGEAYDLAPAIRDPLTVRPGTRFNVIIDALDEAVTPAEAREIIRSVVLPLAGTCSDAGVQVVVGTRQRDDGGDLLGRFGRALDLVDLDKPEYFQEDDLAAYALACLQLAGDERPGGPYSDEASARLLAKAIARTSGTNFLIAGLVARTHGMYDRAAADPARVRPDTSVAAALEDYLKRLAPVAGQPAARLLTALAFAEEPGLTAELWQQAVEALPPTSVTEAWPIHIPLAQFDAFARSGAANFLVETDDTPGPDGYRRRSYRLFHQALNDTLLDARNDIVPRAADERALTRAFTARGRAAGWQDVPEYLLRSLPSHAQAGGLVDELLGDERYLLHADLRRLRQIADDAVTSAGHDRARLLRLTPQALTASPSERAAQFSVTETIDLLGTTFTVGEWNALYRARWAATKPRADRVTLEGGHKGSVSSVLAVSAGGETLLASAGEDGTVRLWDPVTSEQIAVLRGNQGPVWSMCAVSAGGQTLLACSGKDGTVRLWDPVTGEQVAVLKGHLTEVNSVCAVSAGGRALLASAGDHTVRLWDPLTGEQVMVMDGRSEATAVCAVSAGGRTLLASGDGYGRVQLWDPLTGEQVAVLKGHHQRVASVTAVSADGRALLASADLNRNARLWDPLTGKQVPMPEEGIWDRIRMAKSVSIGGRTLLPSTGKDGTVRLRDPATGEREAPPNGYPGKVTSVCAVSAGGRELLASSGEDGTVRLWDPATGEQMAALKGHGKYIDSNEVTSVCAVSAAGRELLASGGVDGTVRLWDPATKEQVAVLDQNQWVTSVCAVSAGGRELLASGTGGGDVAVRLWDPATKEQVKVMPNAHFSWVQSLCSVSAGERTLLASSGNDNKVRLWEPVTGERVAALEGHQVGLYAAWVLAVGPVSAGRRTLLASGGVDGTVRLWDPLTGEQVSVMTGHGGEVNSVCAVQVGGRAMLASSSSDSTVRLWDLSTNACLIVIPVHHAASAIVPIDRFLIICLEGGILAIELNEALFRAPAETR